MFLRIVTDLVLQLLLPYSVLHLSFFLSDVASVFALFGVAAVVCHTWYSQCWFSCSVLLLSFFSSGVDKDVFKITGAVAFLVRLV